MISLWIPFTILAAFMQSWRNALQKQLSHHASTLGVTFARFIVALPLASIYLVLLYCYYPNTTIPDFRWQFALYILIASIMQITATALMVALFHSRNYAVGVGLAKSEAIIAATLGAWFFATPLSLLAWIGVVIGGIAVWLLSLAKQTPKQQTQKPQNKDKQKSLSIQTVSIGLASGLCFALCTLFIRESALILRNDCGQNFLISASWVLFFVLLTQSILLTIWLVIKEPQTLKILYQHKKLTSSVSVFSFFGSIGWFTAMSLQTVAMVKTLGQIEVLFTLAISVYWFKEVLSYYDYLGLGLIVVGAILVMLA